MVLSDYDWGLLKSSSYHSSFRTYPSFTGVDICTAIRSIDYESMQSSICLHPSGSLGPKVDEESTQEGDKHQMLKIGDIARVKHLEISGGDRSRVGHIVTITKVRTGSYTSPIRGQFTDGVMFCFCQSELEKLTTPEESKPMALQPLTDLSNLIQRTFNAQTKTLYRAGYLTKDLNVTKKLTDSLGEMFVGHIIDGTISASSFQTFADELVKRAEEEIAEAEAKEKN